MAVGLRDFCDGGQLGDGCWLLLVVVGWLLVGCWLVVGWLLVVVEFVFLEHS